MSAGPSCSTACAAVAGTRTRPAINEAGLEAPKRLIFRVQHLRRAWEKAAGLAGAAEIRAARLDSVAAFNSLIVEDS
jgi:hypothetical protein